MKFSKSKIYLVFNRENPKNTNTVEPRYFELRYFEVPVISKSSRIPLDLPLFFKSFTIGYFELGYFELPAISNSVTTFMNKQQNTPQHSWKISNFN